MFSTFPKLLLAGGAVANFEDVVEAATRFVADPRVVGRAVGVGPKLKVEQDTDGQWNLVEGKGTTGEEKAIWEVYAHDFEDSDRFMIGILRILNRVVEINGWLGWMRDTFAALKHGMGRSS